MNYKVDERKNTVFKIMEMWENDEVSELKKLDKTIELALGKEAYKEIDEAGFSINDYKTVAMAVMAIISGQSIEEFESRFHEQ